MPTSGKTLQLSEIAKRIKKARDTARLSQVELANQIGVSDKSISAYEQGRSTPPFEKLKKIALVTNHPLAFFTDDDNNEAIISSKLASIERKLIEIKKLLSEQNNKNMR